MTSMTLCCTYHYPLCLELPGFSYHCTVSYQLRKPPTSEYQNSKHHINLCTCLNNIIHELIDKWEVVCSPNTSISERTTPVHCIQHCVNVNEIFRTMNLHSFLSWQQGPKQHFLMFLCLTINCVIMRTWLKFCYVAKGADKYLKNIHLLSCGYLEIDVKWKYFCYEEDSSLVHAHHSWVLQVQSTW